MDASILEIISAVAPTIGKSLTEYFGKNKDVSVEEIQVILLSKVLENNTQMLNNQKLLLEAQHQLGELNKQVCIIITNHIDHEMKALEKIKDTLGTCCQSLTTACEALTDLRIDLIKAKIIK